MTPEEQACYDALRAERDALRAVLDSCESTFSDLLNTLDHDEDCPWWDEVRNTPEAENWPACGCWKRGVEIMRSNVREVSAEAAAEAETVYDEIDAVLAALGSKTVSGVKRYDLDPHSYCQGESGSCLAEMRPTDNGDYVLASDYDALREAAGKLLTVADFGDGYVLVSAARLADLRALSNPGV